MTRAPFIVIDGKLYRWKDILELRRAQLAAAGAAQPTGTLRNLARRPPPVRRAHGIGALSASKLVRKSGRSNKGEPPMRAALRPVRRSLGEGGRGLFAVDGRASFARERKPRLGAVARCPCRLRGV
jgi:hypothetical protein